MSRVFKNNEMIHRRLPAPDAPLLDQAEFNALDHEGETRRECRQQALLPHSVVPFPGGRACVVFTIASARRRYGDYLALYRCVRLTKKGEWSKNWIDLWPGDIERGYDALHDKTSHT